MAGIKDSKILFLITRVFLENLQPLSSLYCLIPVRGRQRTDKAPRGVFSENAEEDEPACEQKQKQVHAAGQAAGPEASGPPWELGRVASPRALWKLLLHAAPASCWCLLLHLCAPAPRSGRRGGAGQGRAAVPSGPAQTPVRRRPTDVLVHTLLILN